MIIQFTLHDLFTFLLYALGITVTVLAIPVLLNIMKVTSVLRAMVVKNQSSIHKSLKSMPGILESAEQTLHNGKEISNQLKSLVPVVATQIEDVTRAAKHGIESAGDILEMVGSGINSTASYRDSAEGEDATGFMAYLPLIKEVLQVINNTFLSKK